MPLLTFEGVEGSGKSTQLVRTAARLRQRGRSVLETREPGGTAIGEKLRSILMDVTHSHLDPVTEWLLIEADRRQHVAETLRPALARGEFVLSDRFSDSTEAYQHEGRGIDPDAVSLVDQIACDGLRPDLTLVYDVDPRTGLARARGRDGTTGRFEAAELAFHDRVRQAYLQIARREPDRVRLIPAEEEASRVFETTWRHVAERFGV